MVKAPKDKNAPKRPQSGYFLFMASPMGRKKVIADHPELVGKPASQVVKLAAARWKELSEDERAPFIEQANKAKAEYKKEFEKYQKTSSYREHQELLTNFKRQKAEGEGKALRKKKFKKDPNAPKRPMGAYFLFSTRFYQANKKADLKMTEISKIASQHWKKMTDEQKKPFVTEAAEKKAEYEQAMEKYRQTEEYQQYEEKKHLFKMEQKRLIEEAEAEEEEDEEEDEYESEYESEE